MRFNKKDIPPDILYKRCLNGDDEAWGFLYAFVLSIIKRRFPSMDNNWAQDKGQMVMLHIRNKMLSRRFNPEINFFSYVGQITLNKIRDWKRSKDTQQDENTSSVDQTIDTDDGDTLPAYQIPSCIPSPEHLVEKKMMNEEIMRAIQRLKSKKRRDAVALYLRLQSNDPDITSLDDIIKALKVPKGTAASLISRGLETLSKDRKLQVIFKEYFN
jgi:RNA polymerase sigma factor (sigma-70 family)